jgi:hypothetical protein
MDDAYRKGWADAVETVREEVRNIDLLAMMREQPHCSVRDRNTHMRPDPMHVVALDAVWLVLDVHASPSSEEAS